MSSYTHVDTHPFAEFAFSAFEMWMQTGFKSSSLLFLLQRTLLLNISGILLTRQHSVQSLKIFFLWWHMSFQKVYKFYTAVVILSGPSTDW